MNLKQTHIPYGFVSGLVMVIFSLTIYLTGYAFNPGVQYLAYIPFLIGVIMNAMAYSKANDGFVNFSNVYGSCFKVSMIVTIVIIAWSIVSTMAFPEMKEKAITMAREEMMKNRKMTDDQVDMAVGITKKYWSAFLIAGALFGTLFYGALFSLVGALIAKKKGAQPFASENF